MQRAIAVIVFSLCITVEAQEFRPPDDLSFRIASIYSEGTRMSAEVFSLKSFDGQKLPTVILCHGWGGTAALLRRTAIALSRAGYLAVAFDYRGWGDSDSRVILTGPAPRNGSTKPFTAEVQEVREIVDPLDQTTDLFNAIHWVQGEPQCDRDRIGLWGSSYSGGHVVFVAARDVRVRALVSQVPHLDSRVIVADPEQRKITYDEATRRARGEIGYPPPGAKVISNLRGAPIRDKLIQYAPVEDAEKASHTAMLFVIAEKEELFDNRDHAIKAYERARGPKKLVVIPGITHYGVYGEAWQQATDTAIQWFDMHLKKVEGGSAVLYRRNCSGCHDTGVPRAPTRQVLSSMSAELILGSLESGTMKSQGEALKPEERKSVAEYLAGRPLLEPAIVRSQVAGGCPENLARPIDLLAGQNWVGWSPGLENTRHQAASAAGLTITGVHSLKLRWVFGFPGAVTALGQPSVAGGRLFVGSQAGAVYSLDTRTGCTYWSFQANARVRTAVSIAKIGNRYAAMFGDGKANVYAVDAFSGQLIWQARVEEHPAALITGSPQFFDGKLYVPVSSWEEAYATDPKYPCCTFRGSVVALDARTGEQIWKTNTIPEIPKPTRVSQAKVQLYGPSGATIWSAPTIDRKRKALYVATGDSYSDPAAPASDAVMALDLDSGRVLWTKQMTSGDAYNMSCRGAASANCPEANGPDFDFGSSPILVELGDGRRLLIAAQKSGFVHALDPDRNGAVVWQKQIGQGGYLGGIQWGPAADRRHVYAAISDVRLNTFRDPSSPVGVRTMPDARTGGGLFALRLHDGSIAWKADPPRCGDRALCSPAQSAAVTLAGDVVFSGALDGHIRAYSAADGKVLWDFDTVREYETVNGIKAKGGALDGPGPVVVGGMLFVNSGYSTFGGMPGNVLLAFSAEGK